MTLCPTMIGDVTKTRLFFQDGHIIEYSHATLAYHAWLSFPKGTKVAFRSAGDDTPVYSHDYVDRHADAP